MIGKSLFICLMVIACVRQPLSHSNDAMRVVENSVDLKDDLSLASLSQALKTNIQFISRHRQSFRSFKFGSQRIDGNDYLLALRSLDQQITDAAQRDANWQSVHAFIHGNFDFFAVYGRRWHGDIFLTAYYEPTIPGSLTPTQRYSQALYREPENIVHVDVRAFLPDKKSMPKQLRGHLVRKGDRLFLKPYPDRRHIDRDKVLDDANLVLCYVDPIDAFFLQIQGSGTILLEDGKAMSLGYANQNGQAYVPIGKFLLDAIPIEEMSLQRIQRHLRGLSKEQRNVILDKNPSYVFFRRLAGRPETSMGTPVTDGRTIATDDRYFPKGALAYLQFEKPIFENDGNGVDTRPTSWQETSRFVIDQDRGGAIRGGGRADLFWGKGAQAKRSAGVMRRPARLHYLVPKPSFLKTLRAKQLLTSTSL